MKIDLSNVVPLSVEVREALDKRVGREAVKLPAPDLGAAEAQLREEAVKLNLDVSKIRLEADGEIRRCPEAGKGKHDDAGWYVAREFKGVIYGTVGNWRTGVYGHWCSRNESMLSEEFFAERRRQQERDKARVAEMKRQAGVKVAASLAHLPEAGDDHPYLVKKGVKAHGLRLDGDKLVIPVCDIEGTVISQQTIDPKGGKLFAYGASAVGMHVIGEPSDNVVLAEGYATGASIHEAIGCRVYVVFSAANMVKLVEEIAAYEGKPVFLAADHDKVNAATGKKAGVEAATAAAEKVSGTVIIPDREGEDWNDVARRSRYDLIENFQDLQPLFRDFKWTEEEEAAITPTDFVYGHHYARTFSSLTVAESGLGKSLLILTEAVAMATGRNLLGIKPEKRVRVCYYNAEDPMDMVRARVYAVCRLHGIDPRELEGWLLLQSGRLFDIELVGNDHGKPRLIEASYMALERFVREREVDVLIFDPLANMHSADETNEVFRIMGKRVNRLASRCNIAVEIVHHTRKSANGAPKDIEDSRGGGALVGTVRPARVLNKMQNPAEYGLESGRPYFCISGGDKTNISAGDDKDVWFEKVAVKLLNGDHIVACRRWDPPDSFSGVTTAHLDEVKRRIRSADPDECRQSPQSEGWWGLIVADVIEAGDARPQKVGGDAAVHRRVKKICETWIRNGQFEVQKVKAKNKGGEVPVVFVKEDADE